MELVAAIRALRLSAAFDAPSGSITGVAVRSTACMSLC
jgi:hypothetical protein